ncbi:MAG: hypothetical protein RBS99_06450 [Rhodospirillales bacterium]|nr:hypothetical protein [Rhodospirillales bacterium]
MKIRIDENVSKRVARAVMELTANRSGFEVSYVRDDNGPKTPDPAWMRRFASDGGTAIVSGDPKILQHWPNLVAYTETGLIGFFPAPFFGNMKGYGRAAFLIRWWPAIVEKIKDADAGTTWRMPASWTADISNFERLKDPRIDGREAQERHGIVPTAEVYQFRPTS